MPFASDTLRPSLTANIVGEIYSGGPEPQCRFPGDKVLPKLCQNEELMNTVIVNQILVIHSPIIQIKILKANVTL